MGVRSRGVILALFFSLKIFNISFTNQIFEGGLSCVRN